MKRVSDIRVNSSVVLWAVYLSLLGVLFPHTAWAFNQFEPAAAEGRISLTAWFAAFAFEAAIAVMTDKLSKHIADGPRSSKYIMKLVRHRVLNWYSLGLVLSMFISGLANLSHAVEFGQQMQIFRLWNISPTFFSFVFGAALPGVSFVFAYVLADAPIEFGDDPELRAAKERAKETEKKLKETERLLKESEKRAETAEIRFGAASDLFVAFAQLEKRDRIRAIMGQYPELPAKYVAMLADSSPSYVSEVKSEIEETELVDIDSLP